MTNQPTDADHAAALISLLAVDAAKPQLVEPGGLYVVHHATGYDLVDLTGDEYLDMPRRKSGTVRVDDVASFAEYYGKHGDTANGAEVFADRDQATITAVLNAHGMDAADWQDHRLILTMCRTDQWTTWLSRNTVMMAQQAFAEFIEDNAADVSPDTTVSAADLLEIAQHFQAHTKVTYGSGTRLATGETQFVYTEETSAGAGKSGTVRIPTEFEIGIRIFDDCAAYRIRARFRYRIKDGSLLLGYHLDDPARKFRAAVDEVIGKAEDACKITIMRGRPS